MHNPTSHQRLTVIVTGRVQGVGFRAHVQDWATQHQITGWVQNRMNGTVEVVAESTRSQLEELLVILELGPPVSSVLNVDATWSKSTGEFKKFQIRYF